MSMRSWQVRLRSITGIVLAGLLFVLAVLIADNTLRGFRADLTADRLYSITDHSQRILDELDGQVTLTLYFSHAAAEGVPYVREYARRVEELLQDYVARSNGRVRLRVVDPRPLTEARERAEAHGLEAVPAGDGSRIFLGLVGTNQFDNVATIDFFEPERERFLEYDISRVLWSLNNPDPRVIGLLTRLPMTERVNPTTNRVEPAWAIMDRIATLGEVRELQSPQHRIADDIDLLMVVHPQRYDDRTLYAIDQYIMRGGRAMFFVDPIADSDSRAGDAEAGTETYISASDPGSLFAEWGIDITLDRALADPRHGLIVAVGEADTPSVHPGMIGIEREGLHPDDAVTAMVDRVVFASPGSIAERAADPRVQALVRTPVTSALQPLERFVGYRRPEEIVQGFRHDGRQHVVAARVDGRVPSAYPDGPPARSQAPAGEHRPSVEQAHMLLFADTDMLTDRMWVRTQRTRDGRSVRNAWTGNGDLVANAVENLTGSDALIAIRGRGTSARPFTRVQALEREAALRYQETEQALRAELEQVEQRMEALRAGQGDNDGDVILAEAQRRELEDSRSRRSELRAELREVQQRLDAEIDALGARLRLLNIALVPVLVMVAAVGVFFLRRRRRRRAGA